MRTPPPSESGPSRRPDSGAQFAAATTAGRPGRPPLYLLVFLAALAGLVGAGFAGRTTSAVPTPAPPAALASSDASAAASTITASPGVSRMPVAPSARTSEPGPLVLTAVRHPESMYVHGDLTAERVTWIYVGLQDERGRVAGWASVNMPGPGLPVPDGDVPTLRFDLDLAVPSVNYPGPVIVIANAYDADGRLAASTRLEMP